MSFLRRPKDAATTQQPGSAEHDEDRLTGVRPLQHDDEERPSREDMTYGETIFTRPPVPLPRWLRGSKRNAD
jgi:hypothetical protein